MRRVLHRHIHLCACPSVSACVSGEYVWEGRSINVCVCELQFYAKVCLSACTCESTCV